MSNAIKAVGKLHQHKIDATAMNPGEWFGKSWLVEIGGSYFPIFLVVEADSVSDAIDELADNETFGHHVIVEDQDLGDYNLEDCHYGASGQVLDLDHIMVYGEEGSDTPFACRYFGERLPEAGILPTEWDEYEEEE
jgi:hypothetical protein